MFSDGATFKAAVKQYAIKVEKNIFVKKNYPTRIRAECHDDNCKWVCLCSPMFGLKKAWVIKTYHEEHNCGRVTKNRFVTLQWLATEYLQYFKDNEKWDVNKFKKNML